MLGSKIMIYRISISPINDGVLLNKFYEEILNTEIELLTL